MGKYYEAGRPTAGGAMHVYVGQDERGPFALVTMEVAQPNGTGRLASQFTVDPASLRAFIRVLSDAADYADTLRENSNAPQG